MCWRTLAMKWIEIKNAHAHNLKHVDVDLRQQALIVFTGVSGSGKSSLAFDTLFVEGQRRYVESLSSSSRRHMEAMQKPPVDSIQGLSPTLSIEQKTVGRSPRSSVGTLTEIHDYLRLLYAKVSIPHCPISKEPLNEQTPANIAEQICELPYEKMLLLAPYAQGKRGHLQEEREHLMRLGYSRARLDGELVDLAGDFAIDPHQTHDLEALVDRITPKSIAKERLLESVNQALQLGEGICLAVNWKGTDEPQRIKSRDKDQKQTLFATARYAPASGRSYPALQPHDFSPNSPAGMCPRCQGLGIAQDWDLSRILDPQRSIAADPCAVATSYQTVRYRNIFDNLAALFNFSVHTPWKALSAEAQRIYLRGCDRPYITMQFVHPITKKRWIDRIQWKGVLHEAWTRYQGYKTQTAKERLADYLIQGQCSECQGERITPYPRNALLVGRSLPALCRLPIDEMLEVMKGTLIHLQSDELLIAKPLIKEVERRLLFLQEVGLGYLSLDRQAPTLSGGESQRVRLASQVGCGLVGMTYILDEPSIGLHPIDNQKLINTLRRLRDQGNTVVVVEHDEDAMRAADQIVDFGPQAGAKGGCVLFSGSSSDLLKCQKSVTARYLADPTLHLLPQKESARPKSFLQLQGAEHHNLQNVDLQLPLKRLCAIAGVSGSGKSSLLFDVLYPALVRALGTGDLPMGKFRKLRGWESIQRVIRIDQSPIGRLPRSNPATYTKVFDEIREIFAQLPESRSLGFKAGRFSFNVAEGSCSHCQGMGWIEIDMEFVANEFLRCATCRGRRFDEQTLSVAFRGKSIADVLDLTVAEAIGFFDAHIFLKTKLLTLQKVGLDYLKLGQPSPQLSGGEAQRVKLAKELAKTPQSHTLYLLDEPTTGLHSQDTMGLLRVLRELVTRGHSVVVIEHHIDILRNSDWVIELGPGGGPKGGKIIAGAPPDQLAGLMTPTGQVLAQWGQRDEKTTPTVVPPPKIGPSAPIVIEGARQNNLKNLTLSLTRDQMIICAGPSGSGKSSFAFETIYAEGQRRYVDTLAPYARQFVQQLQRPLVDRIEGLSPAIAIEQKRHAGNARSTVGTLTEIYDHLRLLFARMGQAHCPETHELLQAMNAHRLSEILQQQPEGAKLQILAPVTLRRGESVGDLLNGLLKSGYSRIRVNGEIRSLDFSEVARLDQISQRHQFEVVVDRLKVGSTGKERWLQSIEQALSLRAQRIAILEEGNRITWFHMGFCSVKTGKSYPLITPKLLSFNHAEGQCAECEGIGTTTGIAFAKHLEIDALSFQTLLTLLWGKVEVLAIKKRLEGMCKERGFALLTPIHRLDEAQSSWLFGGDRHWQKKWESQSLDMGWLGLYPALTRLAKGGDLPTRLALSHYLEIIPCPACKGARLNALALGVKLNGVNLPELCSWPIDQAHRFLKGLEIGEENRSLHQVWVEILSRLAFLSHVGLDYLSLDRQAPTLSNGEAQRIRLAAQLGSQLTGVLYVLDEPSTGLHPYDSERLGKALLSLRDLGNTLLVVEHDLSLMRLADEILEFGPAAGIQGGEIIARGTPLELQRSVNSLTGPYLAGKKSPIISKRVLKSPTYLQISNARANNLKGFSARIPLPSLTCLTGVSGSGKSTLMRQVLMASFSASQRSLQRGGEEGPPLENQIAGLENFQQFLYIDQNPPGRTHRAEVGTYIEVFAKLRVLFASTPAAKLLGLTSSHFSPNTAKGMCKVCQGAGVRKIDLRFMSPVILPCGECRGERLSPLANSVTYRGKSFGQLFKMTARECGDFFADHPPIRRALDAICSVGLGYLALGQEVATLSGGEAQRLKISEQLRKRHNGAILYLFDEPTIGLHPSDIEHLIGVLHSLVDDGHTVICIEHNLTLIRAADWILDLGPGPGDRGGDLIAMGSVADIAKKRGSKTGQFLKKFK